MPIRKKRTLIVSLLVALISLSALFIFTRLSASGCTSVESYDAITGSCYYDCTSDADCAQKAKAVDAELDSFFDGSKTKTTTTKTRPTSQTQVASQTQTRESTGSETDGTVYTVTKDLTLQPTPTKTDQGLWNLFSKVAGKDDLSKYIQSFEVFNDPNNDSAASVWQSQTQGKWHMNVNAAYLDDKKDLVHTMVHEYGHIVSLNAAQIDGSVAGSCPNLTLDEGCARSGSYINAFYNQFWQKYGEDVPSEQGQNSDEVASFYAENRDAFVSEYAATNYGEDWAETWAMFVIQQKPSGTAEKVNKILSLYTQPSLVDTRNRIRVQIAASL